MDEQPVKGVPCLSAHDSWDKLQICMDNFLYCMYVKPFESEYMIIYKQNVLDISSEQTTHVRSH